MTPTHEQLIEEIAGKLWRDLCEGEGQHSEALDKSLIREHMDRLAACLAAPPPQVITDCKVFPDESGLEPFLAPEPQAMPPIEIGDWVYGNMSGPWHINNDALADSWRKCSQIITEIRKANGTVWTREPRR